MMDRYKAVRIQIPSVGGGEKYCVVDLATQKRVTQIRRESWNKHGELKRHGAKQIVRKLAKRFNHRDRLEMVG